MPSLKDLIPAHFFVKPPATPDLTHGRLSVTRDGKVLAEWEKRSKVFDANLAAARELKTGGYGTYRPDAGGWIFHRNAAELADAKFPDTLVRTPEFLALVKASDGKTLTEPATAAPTAAKKHGRVKVNGNQFLVQWGGEAGFCPRDAFDRYLTAARAIKADYPGCNGWNKPLNGWLLTRTAAAKIVKCFPAATFDHCPELAADAAANPDTNDEPAPANVAPNALTVALLAAAERVFGTFA